VPFYDDDYGDVERLWYIYTKLENTAATLLMAEKDPLRTGIPRWRKEGVLESMYLRFTSTFVPDIQHFEPHLHDCFFFSQSPPEKMSASGP
jgi:hypothetical protein